MTTRRTFLKTIAVGAGSALIGPDRVDAAHKHDVSPNTLSVLTDVSLCVGCRSCEEACNKVNSLPKPEKPFDDLSVLNQYRRMDVQKYTVVNKYPSKGKRDAVDYVKIQCMHCNDPGCVSACLVGAMQKTPEGPVIWDEAKCIGCRYCMIACPFGVPAYEYSKGIEPRVMKCTMCHPRIKKGLMPGCAAACPMNVMVFGPRRKLLEVARERIKKNPQSYDKHIYGEMEVGGTGWLFLLPQDYETLGFIKLPNEAPPRLTESIQHGVFKFFLPPVALFATLGLLMASTKHAELEESNHEEMEQNDSPEETS